MSANPEAAQPYGMAPEPEEMMLRARLISEGYKVSGRAPREFAFGGLQAICGHENGKIFIWVIQGKIVTRSDTKPQRGTIGSPNLAVAPGLGESNRQDHD